MNYKSSLSWILSAISGSFDEGLERKKRFRSSFLFVKVKRNRSTRTFIMAAKPVLRNLLLEKTKRDFVLASVLAVAVAAAYKFGVQERRRSLFNDFHKTYDAKKDYNRMKQAGVFQSINQAVEEGKMSLE